MNETKESLLKFEPNEFVVLVNEGGITAIYIRALQDDCFSHFQYKLPPVCSFELQDKIQKYRLLKKVDQIIIWKELFFEYKGYFEAVEKTRYENLSNKYFLEAMRAHFEKIGMLSYAEKCRLRLLEFLE